MRSEQWKKEEYARLCRIAEERGGRMLTERFLGATTKHLFVDAAGRSFEKRPSDLKRGEWSPYESNCVRDPAWHLDQIRLIAETRGGRLLSTEYKGAFTKLDFEDADGRTFSMGPHDVKQGQWSPWETKRVRDPNHHLAELRTLAECRGGRLVSEIYVNTHTKLEFEDAAGNRFIMAPQDAKQGRWSPFEGPIGETLCRQVFEAVFGKSFPSCWGVVARSNGRSLQLDGFNPAVPIGDRLLPIAFEYQGAQHYKPTFSDDPTTHQEQLRRDEEKRQACQNHQDGPILLIEVPEFRGASWLTEPFLDHVMLSVRPRLAEWGLPCPLPPEGFELDLSKVNRAVRALMEIALIAEERGGKLLSDKWMGNDVHLRFVDADGQVFERTPSNVKSGGWGPTKTRHVLSGLEEDTEPRGFPAIRLGSRLDQLRQYAIERGGRLVEDAVANGRQNFVFEDAQGRRFERRADHIERGLWSPWETGRVRDPDFRLSELKRAAQRRGGDLLSERWAGVKARYAFVDVAGHHFSATAEAVMTGRWSLMESNRGGAKREIDEDGLLCIQTADGHTILYEFNEDEQLQILQHTSPDGQTRTWDVAGEPDAPEMEPGGIAPAMEPAAPRLSR